MRGKTCLRHGLGVGAILLLVTMLLHAAGQKPHKTQATQQEVQTWNIQWEPDVLVYDGTGALNLLEGVTVTDQDGVDKTPVTCAVIKETNVKSKKIVYYTTDDETLPLSEQGRLLILENYTGPVLEVEKELNLMASQLKNLIPELVQQGCLIAENGYGIDISQQVSWYREKVREGEYLFSFTVINEFYDAKTVQSRAYVVGVTDDITLKLQEQKLTIPKGETFIPETWIQYAKDSNGKDLSSRVKVEGTVDVSNPGTYTLRYILTSVDGTQRAVEEMTVTVKEETT